MKVKTDVSHFLFLSAYLMGMLDAMIMGFSTYNQLLYSSIISWGLRGCSAVFILIKLFLDSKYSVVSLVYSILTGFLLAVSYINSGYVHLFYILLIALGIRHVDIERVVRIDIYVHVFLVVIIILSGLTGIIENYVTYRIDSPWVLRYSMGFTHPNVLAIHVLAILLKDVWINKRLFSVQYMLLVWLITALVYWVTTSRTSVVLMACYPILMLLIVGRGNKKPLGSRMSVCVKVMLPAAVLLCLLAMEYCDTSEILGFLDEMTSRRFSNSRAVYERYDLGIFGRRVELVSVKQARLLQTSLAILDVAYLRLLMQGGPIVMMLLIWMHMRAVDEAVRCNDKHAILILCVFVISGISETQYNNPYLNFSLMFGASAAFVPIERRRFSLHILDKKYVVRKLQ